MNERIPSGRSYRDRSAASGSGCWSTSNSVAPSKRKLGRSSTSMPSSTSSRLRATRRARHDFQKKGGLGHSARVAAAHTQRVARRRGSGCRWRAAAASGCIHCRRRHLLRYMLRPRTWSRPFPRDGSLRRRPRRAALRRLLLAPQERNRPSNIFDSGAKPPSGINRNLVFLLVGLFCGHRPVCASRCRRRAWRADAPAVLPVSRALASSQRARPFAVKLSNWRTSPLVRPALRSPARRLGTTAAPRPSPPP